MKDERFKIVIENRILKQKKSHKLSKSESSIKGLKRLQRNASRAHHMGPAQVTSHEFGTS